MPTHSPWPRSSPTRSSRRFTPTSSRRRWMGGSSRPSGGRSRRRRSAAAPRCVSPARSWWCRSSSAPGRRRSSCVPVILEMRKSECYEPLVVSTGQHNRMVDYIFELAGIKPDVALWAGSRRSNLNERVSAVMKRFEDFCADRFELGARPDADPRGHAERALPGGGPGPRRHQLGDGGGALGLPPADPGDARRGRAAHRRQQPHPLPGGAEPTADHLDRRRFTSPRPRTTSRT